MNIKQAKEEIKNAMKAYFTKNDIGEYVIPIEKQRPVLLIGPPGIGKTHIMEQIAQELGVGLLSYSMTHHTRQSALGLPFIETKTYGGKEYQISEYTMSEIIASVYDKIEESGVKEGILFLDEINCVSETLAPAMLQFLQYKTFARHSVPSGWLVVTAGNPPEYNNSVREFDMVTLDRLKKIEVEADYSVWKEYALNNNIHPAITSYLEIKSLDFYIVESTIDGKNFVTARGWEDLSSMLDLYELHKLPIDESLVVQYLQKKRVAKDFAVYYDLFNKYRSDYQIEEILSGIMKETIIERGRRAKFDERLALIGLLLDAVSKSIASFFHEEEMVMNMLPILKEVKSLVAKSDKAMIIDTLRNEITSSEDKENRKLVAGNLRMDEKIISSYYRNALSGFISELTLADNVQKGEECFKLLKSLYDKQTKSMRLNASAISDKLNNMFIYAEKAFGKSQEILIIATELTINRKSARFISNYGCEMYFKHNKELLLNERHGDILRQIEDFEIEVEVE